MNDAQIEQIMHSAGRGTTVPTEARERIWQRVDQARPERDNDYVTTPSVQMIGLERRLDLEQDSLGHNNRRNPKEKLVRPTLVLAAAVIILLAVLGMPTDRKTPTPVAGPSTDLITDPDRACDRFGAANFDRSMLNIAQSALPPTSELVVAEGALAQLHADFAASDQRRRVRELLGQGQLEDLERVAQIMAQTRRQADQGLDEQALESLRLVPQRASPLFTNQTQTAETCLARHLQG